MIRAVCRVFHDSNRIEKERIICIFKYREMMIGLCVCLKYTNITQGFSYYGRVQYLS